MKVPSEVLARDVFGQPESPDTPTIYRRGYDDLERWWIRPFEVIWRSTSGRDKAYIRQRGLAKAGVYVVGSDTLMYDFCSTWAAARDSCIRYAESKLRSFDASATRAFALDDIMKVRRAQLVWSIEQAKTLPETEPIR